MEYFGSTLTPTEANLRKRKELGILGTQHMNFNDIPRWQLLLLLQEPEGRSQIIWPEDD